MKIVWIVFWFYFPFGFFFFASSCLLRVFFLIIHARILTRLASYIMWSWVPLKAIEMYSKIIWFSLVSAMFGEQTRTPSIPTTCDPPLKILKLFFRLFLWLHLRQHFHFLLYLLNKQTMACLEILIKFQNNVNYSCWLYV